MFRSTVTSSDGTTSEGTSSEADAWRTLRTAVRRGYSVEATRQGGAIIVREIPHAGDTWQPARKHTVTLEPVTHAGTVTATMRGDLDAIARWGRSRLTGDRIRAGFIYGIPPAATARLMQRGLVTVDGETVSVSLVARLAMLAQDHHTETREPRGYVHPSDIGADYAGAGLNKPGRRAGKILDRSSVASCSCRRWSYPAEDRDNARRRAHEHKQEVTAAMVRALDSAAAA